VHPLVQRVNWLRAKARVDRWAEELVMVQDQMGNTIRFFKRRSVEWLARAENSWHPGHICYAHQQADMWQGLAEKAITKFGNNAV